MPDDQGMPRGVESGVGRLEFGIRDNEPPPRTDLVQQVIPGICISTASGQVNVLTTEETK